MCSAPYRPVDSPRRIAPNRGVAGLGSGGRASALGIEIGIAIVGGLVAGYWADGRFGTSPWLTLGGFGFGCLVAGRAIWRAADEASREE